MINKYSLIAALELACSCLVLFLVTLGQLLGLMYHFTTSLNPLLGAGKKSSAVLCKTIHSGQGALPEILRSNFPQTLPRGSVAMTAEMNGVPPAGGSWP